jgi:hypothetical protein
LIIAFFPGNGSGGHAGALQLSRCFTAAAWLYLGYKIAMQNKAL